jgi:hypothetical protein
MKAWKVALGVLLLGLLLWAGRGGGAPRRTVLEAAAPALPEPRGPTHRGALSCSGRSCHGGAPALTGDPGRGTEHALWLREDRHARAYQDLLGERAEAMLRRLGAPGPAHRAPRCLACHVTPALVADGDAGRRLAEGVGCEACHGAAARWWEDHTRPEWRDRPARAKAAQGLTPLGHAPTLARGCVGCHVGAPPEGAFPAREVSHDLIAAGHPPLRFAFTRHLAALPPHWRAAKQQAQQAPAFRATAWAAGQVAAARAAADLLAWQARQAAADPRDWPDLAGYDCFACHRGLGPRSGRPAGSGKRQDAWGSWYWPLARSGAPGDELREAMSAAAPDPAVVTAVLGRLRPHLDSRWDALQADQAAPPLRAWLRDHQVQAAAEGWDGAAQVYLAWTALAAADAPPHHQEALAKLGALLAFPPGRDGPAAWHTLDGPAVDVAKVLSDLGR